MVAVEVTVRAWEVRHIQRVHRSIAVLISGNLVPSVCLVNTDLTLVALVREALLGVHLGLSGSRPGGDVDGGALELAGGVLPLHKKRDRVLSACRAPIHALRNACRAQSLDTHGPSNAVHSPAVDVNMVGVQVVGDVRGAACPVLERVQLSLRLGHKAVEVSKVSQCANARAGILINGIEPLVVFNHYKHTLALSCLNKRAVFLQSLHRWFCNKDMAGMLDGIHSDVEMRIIGSEDRDKITRLKLVDRSFVRNWISFNMVFRIGLNLDIHVVHFTDLCFQVVPNAIELCAGCADKSKIPNFPEPAKLKQT
eukprot:Colp12_sorted_trinity150504_noHs@15348